MRDCYVDDKGSADRGHEPVCSSHGAKYAAADLTER